MPTASWLQTIQDFISSPGMPPPVAYLAGLIVVTPYAAGSCDTSAAGLAEANVDIVLKYLKLVSDAECKSYLQRNLKLVEWYAAALNSDRHAPALEEVDEEAPKAGEGGEERVAVMPNELVNNWNPISRPKKTDRRTGKAVADSNRGTSEQVRDTFEPAQAAQGCAGPGRHEEACEIAWDLVDWT